MRGCVGGGGVTDPRLALKWAASVIPDSANREKDDFYPTPPEGTAALLSAVTFEGNIWEPACGDGAISKVLRTAGYEVISTDLVNRGFGTPRVDFLMEHGFVADNIVTNPPFKLAEQFAEHALKHARRKVCLLARLAWLEGESRRKMFESTPLSRVLVFSRRLNMSRAHSPASEMGGLIAFAWFVWEHGHVGPPTLGWLQHPGPRRHRSRPAVSSPARLL